MVEPNDLGKLSFIKVTADGITNFPAKFSKVSASAKIDAPSARAVNPPSGASSTMKINSLIAILYRRNR